MISYIKGEITHKNPTFIIVETGGIGYHVNVSLYTYARIEKEERIKILIHQHIKEDSNTLYGFSEETERSLFILLISVSGIGPNTARVILSGMTPEEVRASILGENVAAFNQVKGIGPKTAKRIILDLKDKVIKDSGNNGVSLSVQDNTLRAEALSALVALGFAKVPVQKTLNRVLQAEKFTSVEQLIKVVLKQLS